MPGRKEEWTREQSLAGNSIAVYGPIVRGCHEEICRCTSWRKEEHSRLIIQAPRMYNLINALLEAEAAGMPRAGILSAMRRVVAAVDCKEGEDK